MSKLGDSNTVFLGTLTWANITSKPTTLSGYGITDALSTSGGTLTGNLNINYSGNNYIIINSSSSQNDGGLLAQSDAGLVQLIKRKSNDTGNFSLGLGSTELTSVGNQDFGIGTYTGTGSLILGTNNTQRFKIDGSGNSTFYGSLKASTDFNVLANGISTEVRIGGSAKTWHDEYDVLQIKDTAFLNNSNTTRIFTNAYYNFVNEQRMNEGYAFSIYIGEGNSIFQYAGNDVSDSAITWTKTFQTGISGNAFGTVTPKPYNSSYPSLQIGGLTAIYSNASESAGSWGYLTQNAWVDGSTWKYKIADEASMIEQVDGNFSFNYVDTGTSDGTISAWTKTFQTGISGNAFGTSTLKTWNPECTAVQIGQSGAISSNASGSDYVSISMNGYTTSNGWKYKANNEWSDHVQGDGNHVFRWADTGTADATVTPITSFQTGKSGTTFYQNVTLPNDPTSAMHCATKQYVDSVASSALLANTYKNHAVDGGFNIAQTATTATNPTAQSYPVCDMWKVAEYASVLPTLVHSQQKVTPEELYGAHYFYRINSNGNGTSPSSATLSTFIENGVRNLFGSGKTITVSFYAKTSITGKKIGIMLYNSYGTGGSPSSPFDINGTTFTLTSSWTKYSYTFTTTSLSGVTFGTNNDDYISPMIFYAWNEGNGARVGAGGTVEYFGNGNIEFAKFKVNVGSTATEFEQEDIKDVLDRSRRYLHPILTTSECGLTGFALYNTAMYTRFTFRCTMRIVPALLRIGGSSTIARTVQFNSTFGISGTPSGTCTLYDSTTDFTSFAITSGPISGVINIEVDLIGTGITAYFLDARF